MTNTSRKRSLTIAGHRTSVSLEEPFWSALADIAREDGKSVAGLIREIDTGRAEAAEGGDEAQSRRTGEEATPNLSSAIRLYVLARLNEKRGMP